MKATYYRRPLQVIRRVVMMVVKKAMVVSSTWTKSISQNFIDID